MTNEETKEVTNETGKLTKKEYRRPELKTYGDIRSVTKGGSAAAVSDSGTNMMSPP